MDQPYPLQVSGADRLRETWTRIFLFLTATLTATVGFEFVGLELLRVHNIQYLEIVYIFQLTILIVSFPRHNFRTRVLRTVAVMGTLYLLFLAAAFALSLLALRNDFYLPTGLPFLKHPGWYTLSRMIEFIIDMSIMLYLIQLFRANRNNLMFTMRMYFGVGLASAVFCIVTLPLHVYYGIQLGTYLSNFRFRGFYNEGGAYGTYVITVFCVAVALSRLGWIPKWLAWSSFAILIIALIGSQSKSALFALGLIMLFNAVMVKGVWGKLGIVAALLATASVPILVPSIGDELVLYYKAPEKYEFLSNIPGERDLLYGRMAGAFMVRRMITVHPLAGIGWGNYSLVRNSPEYRGGSKWLDATDDPGLGILGAAADFGIPLTLFLIGVTFYPYFYLRRRGAPLALKNLALMQPVMHLCGAQLSLTYPWLITAFALGLGYYYVRGELEPHAEPDGEGSSPALALPMAAAPENAT